MSKRNERQMPEVVYRRSRGDAIDVRSMICGACNCVIDARGFCSATCAARRDAKPAAPRVARNG